MSVLNIIVKWRAEVSGRADLVVAGALKATSRNDSGREGGRGVA